MPGIASIPDHEYANRQNNTRATGVMKAHLSLRAKRGNLVANIAVMPVG